MNFESWNSDVELGNGREFEDGEAEWEAEFRRRAWRPRPVAPLGIIPRRPWRPRPVARPGIIPRRPFRQPFRGWRPVRWPRPPRPVYYPVILPQWGGWLPDGQPREPAAAPTPGAAARPAGRRAPPRRPDVSRTAGRRTGFCRAAWRRAARHGAASWRHARPNQHPTGTVRVRYGIARLRRRIVRKRLR